MRDNFAQYFDKPEFRASLARYEEMLMSDHTSYFEATELTDIAEYYAMQGDSEKAEAALDYALRLHPENIDALIFKSRARLINGHLAEARHILDSITDQRDREVLFLRAEVLLASHQHTQAEALLRSLIEEEGYEANAYADIIDLLVDNNQHDMASLWIEEAIQRHPDHQTLNESAAYSHVLQERFDEAIALYNRLLDIDPYSTFYWEELGKIYFRREEYDKAIEEYKIVIEQDPTYASAYNNLGVCYSDLAQQVSDASASLDFRSKAFKASQAKMKDYYRLALPMFEKLRVLDDGTDPMRRAAWTNGLYNCYYILNMGAELKEIEKLMNAY